MKTSAGIDFLFEVMKKSVISAGERNSIIIQAHLALMVRPHPFLRNLPYGAETKKSRIKTIIAKEKIANRE